MKVSFRIADPMNLLHVTAALLLIGYTATTPLSVESDADEDALPKCPAGQRAIVTCEVCPTGYYTQNAGFWETCVPCGEGRTTVPDMPHKCVTECSPGWTWNGKKCAKCEVGLVKPDPGNHECEPCYGYWKSNKQATECNVLECPPGYEPKTLEDGTMTCSPCNFGYFKKYSGGSDLFCEKCRKDQWTISTASILMSDCIRRIPDDACEASYPELVEAIQVAYHMSENDTIGEYLCEHSDIEPSDIRTLIDHVSDCQDVIDSVSGQEIIPVYKDETKEIAIADIAVSTPTCAVIVIDPSPSWSSGDACWDWWHSSSSWYYSGWSSSSSFWWSSSSSSWWSSSSSSWWSSSSSSYWSSSGSSWWSSSSSNYWSSSSSSWWSSSSSSYWSSSDPWWTSCLSSSWSSSSTRPIPGLFGSGTDSSSGRFPIPGFWGTDSSSDRFPVPGFWGRGGSSSGVVVFPGVFRRSGMEGSGFDQIPGSGGDLTGSGTGFGSDSFISPRSGSGTESGFDPAMFRRGKVGFFPGSGSGAD